MHVVAAWSLNYWYNPSAITKEDVNWNKKSHIKMALLDCAINKKCCTVDGGRSICPLFSSPPRGICQLKSRHPREFAILGAGGIDWCIKHIYFDVSNNYDCGITGTHNVLLDPFLTIFHITDRELKPGLWSVCLFLPKIWTLTWNSSETLTQE